MDIEQPQKNVIMTSLQVCHCRVTFYIPTKFHDDRNLSNCVYVFKQKIAILTHVQMIINECAKFN